MKKNERRIISEEIGTMSPYDFDGSIESVVKQLQERFLPTDMLNLCCGWEQDRAYYAITRDRQENDAEYAARLREEERIRDEKKKTVEQKERAEYERLKKKFENG